jgi:hypothetical protein
MRSTFLDGTTPLSAAECCRRREASVEEYDAEMQSKIPMILAAAAAAAACASAQDETPDDLDRHDVRALVSALNETSMGFRFTSPPIRSGGAGEASVHYVWPEVESRQDAEEAIVDLVRFGTGPGREGAIATDQLFAGDGWLHVTGGARLRASVPRVLRDLGALLQAVEIELAILPPEALAAVSSAVLDAAKLERLTSVAKPLATMRTRVRPGSETLFEAVGRRAYVKDYDTEVAQESKATNPLIDVIPEGTRLSVRVDPAPDGAFIVTVRGQQADANGIARARPLQEGAALLQLPRNWWGSASASARVPDQGALVIGNDVTPRSVWVVRVVPAPRAAAPADAGIALVRVSAATRPPLWTTAPTFRSPNPSGADGLSEDAGPDHDRRRVDADLLMRRLRGLRPEGVAETARRAEHIGPFVALGGDPRYVAAASALAGKVVDEVTRGYSVEVRLGTVPAAGFRPPAAEELEAFAGTLPQRALTAAIGGDRVVLIGGEAHAYLKDRDVEIAQGMMVDDPVVDVFFTGFSMSVEVLPAGETACSLDLRLDYQELLELASAATGSNDVTEIELPRIASAVARVPIDLALGSWALAHSAPLDGTDRQLVVMIHVDRT